MVESPTHNELCQKNQFNNILTTIKILENFTLSPQMRRHIADELDHLEKYQAAHPDEDHDPTAFEMYCDENPEADECRIYGGLIMLEATSTGFNPEYIGILPRWFGRIVSSETWQDNIVPHTFSDPDELKGWAFRYKVRIFSWNTGDPGVVPDEQLHMANVVLPVTAGSGHGGYFETPSLAAGSVVTGFFP